MTEFVGHAIGSRHYSYPETPRGAGALAFARNFAFGPITDLEIDDGAGTVLLWETIESFPQWSATTTYAIGANVNFDGISYTSLANGNTGNQPDLFPLLWAPSPTSGTFSNVPITPRATGVVRVIGVISLKSAAVGAENVQVVVQVNGVSLEIPELEQTTITAGGRETLPVLTEITGLPLNTVANVRIVLIATAGGVISAVDESCSLELHEVIPATG